MCHPIPPKNGETVLIGKNKKEKASLRPSQKYKSRTIPGEKFSQSISTLKSRKRLIEFWCFVFERWLFLLLFAIFANFWPFFDENRGFGDKRNLKVGIWRLKPFFSAEMQRNRPLASKAQIWRFFPLLPFQRESHSVKERKNKIKNPPDVKLLIYRVWQLKWQI